MTASQAPNRTRNLVGETLDIDGLSPILLHLVEAENDAIIRDLSEKLALLRSATPSNAQAVADQLTSSPSAYPFSLVPADLPPEIAAQASNRKTLAAITRKFEAALERFVERYPVEYITASQLAREALFGSD